VEWDRNALGLSGLQRQLRESFEFLRWTRDRTVGVSNVQLGYSGGRPGSRIGHIEADHHRIVSRGRGRRNFQVLIGERAVREAKTKGKERLDLVLIEVAVADKYAFVVFDALRAVIRIVALVGRVVFPPPLEGNWQMA